MNRIHNKNFDEGSYEFRRKKDLEPILTMMDYVIDLHSTSKNTDILAISSTKFFEINKSWLDCKKILVEENISKTGAIIGVCYDHNIPSVGLECGTHTSTYGHELGFRNVKNLLIYLKMLMGEKIFNEKFDGTFQFIEEIVPKTYQFKYSKDYHEFEEIPPGEIYATDNHKLLKNTENQSVFIGLRGKTIKPGDGDAFLFKKLNFFPCK